MCRGPLPSVAPTWHTVRPRRPTLWRHAAPVCHGSATLCDRRGTLCDRRWHTVGPIWHTVRPTWHTVRLSVAHCGTDLAHCASFTVRPSAAHCAAAPLCARLAPHMCADFSPLRCRRSHGRSRPSWATVSRAGRAYISLSVVFCSRLRTMPCRLHANQLLAIPPHHPCMPLQRSIKTSTAWIAHAYMCSHRCADVVQFPARQAQHLEHLVLQF